MPFDHASLPVLAGLLISAAMGLAVCLGLQRLRFHALLQG
jgi:hypothetical protein